MNYTELLLKSVNQCPCFSSDSTPDEDYCSSLHQSTGGAHDAGRDIHSTRSPYHDWGPWLPSVGWMHASISVFPCLRSTPVRPSLWNRVSHHWRHGASSAWGPTFCACFPHMAGSPVIQGQSETSGRTPRPIASSQKPIFNAPSWQTPPNSSDHLHTQTRSRDETIVPTVCLLGVWSDSSYLHASADRDNQYLGRIAKLLLTHPYNTTNILAKSCWKSPQPTILQYVPVFALQIMRHDNLKENARWFSKKHTRYWTANLLGRVQPNWQQFDSHTRKPRHCTGGADRHSPWQWDVEVNITSSCNRSQHWD